MRNKRVSCGGFQSSMAGALEAGVGEAQKKVSEGFGPLLDSWKAMTVAHQQEMETIYGRMRDQAAEQYKSRLENVFQPVDAGDGGVARSPVAGDDFGNCRHGGGKNFAKACAQVFAGVGESLRERLSEMARNFTPPSEPSGRAQKRQHGKLSAETSAAGNSGARATLLSP